MAHWYLFLLLTASTSTSVNGPMSSREDCEYFHRQVEKELKPFKAACIEVPSPKEAK